MTMSLSSRSPRICLRRKESVAAPPIGRRPRHCDSRFCLCPTKAEGGRQLRRPQVCYEKRPGKRAFGKRPRRWALLHKQLLCRRFYTPPRHGPDANHQTGISRKAVARIIDLQPKRRAFTPAGTASPRSITFERPSTVLSDPDAADRLSASLDLALACYKSRADEAY
jgi:hypothetical protein